MRDPGNGGDVVPGSSTDDLDLQYLELESIRAAFADLHFRLTSDGTYVQVWAADPSVLVVPLDEIAGSNVADHFPPLLSARFLDAIQLAISTSEVTSVQYRLGDGDAVRHYEVRLAPLGTDEVMAVVRDVSSLNELEHQLVHAQTMQSIGRLAGGIAHDFNNVLHVIRGHAQALQRHRADPTETDRRVEAITRAVDRTSSLVERLMILSRPTVDNPTPTRVDAFLQGLGPTLNQLLGDSIELEFDLDADGCAVAIDDSRFENLLLNLATNALDAMPDGGALRFVTRCQLDDSIVLEVSDTGDGIDPDVAPRVFEPFFTTKGPGIGTGLGLATTYASITAAGGSVVVDSSPGVGTTFTIMLPTTPDRPLPDQPTDEAAPHSRDATILVVEDEPDVLGLCVDALRDIGFDVLEATDASGALAYIDGGRNVDLMLTDVVMPGMSGLQLADEAARRQPNMPVVFMTGYAADTAVAGRDVSPAELLRKPFTEAELSRAVNAKLSETARESERRDSTIRNPASGLPTEGGDGS